MGVGQACKCLRKQAGVEVAISVVRVSGVRRMACVFSEFKEIKEIKEIKDCPYVP